jgi:hypothetical protein
VPNRIAGVKVREVNLDGRDGHPANCVVQRDAGVRVAPRVDHQSDAILRSLVHEIDQLPFAISLVGANFETKLLTKSLEATIDLSERQLAVDLGFAAS